MATRWAWASASVRGTAHVRSGTRKQDAYSCSASGDFLVCIVSDGAGSAQYGGEGASIVCRTLSEAARDYVRNSRGLPSQELVLSWLDLARDRIAYAAGRRSSVPRDFAATLVSVISDGNKTLIAQVGDGCAALLDGSGQWRIPVWPDHGEYASTTSFVTEDPEAKCRFAYEQSGVLAVAALTDGLERLAIDFASQSAFAGFFNGMTKPVLSTEAIGRDRALSAGLASYLEGASVCARTDDDKTLVIAARK